jgi:hypothetical protein
MVVWSKIIPIAALGVAILFLSNAFTRPASAAQTASAINQGLSSFGVAGSSIGQLGRGIGGGIAGLFQPVWEIANLFERFSGLSGGSANVSPVAQEGTAQQGGGYSPVTWTVMGGQQASPGSIYDVGGSNIQTSTISWDSGTTATVPLSQEARDYYKKLGVSID